MEYECKNCKQILLTGLVNELDEMFCNQSCYKQYCEEHGFEPHFENLK